MEAKLQSNGGSLLTLRLALSAQVSEEKKEKYYLLSYSNPIVIFFSTHLSQASRTCFSSFTSQAPFNLPPSAFCCHLSSETAFITTNGPFATQLPVWPNTTQDKLQSLPSLQIRP